MLMAGVLVVAGCGSGDDRGTEPPPTADATSDAVVSADVEGVERVAEHLVALVGDERSAAAAVLLASDRGYSIVQIVEATVGGLLDAGGQASDSDGSPLAPEYEPKRDPHR